MLSGEEATFTLMIFVPFVDLTKYSARSILKSEGFALLTFEEIQMTITMGKREGKAGSREQTGKVGLS